MDRFPIRRLSASIRARLSYANVVATMAVFLALGGASYAAVSLPRGSVGSKQLRRHAVTQSKLAIGGVGTKQLRRRSVRGAKLARGGVKKGSLSPWIRRQLARRAAPGPPGPTGSRGATGPRGPGAVRVHYSAAESATPNFVTALNTNGLTVRGSCDVGGGTTTLTFAVRSAQAATLQETLTIDQGTDPTTPPAGATTGNLQINLPAGATLQPGGPSADSGYTRVAVEGVYSTGTTTIDLHLFAIVNADAGRCSIDGLAVPA
jgi:hypothetical protein